MKSDKLQDAIGEVKDEYIADAHPEAAAPQKKNRRIVWVAVAAALALVCGLGIYALVGGRNAGESVKPGFATLEEPNVKPSKPESSRIRRKMYRERTIRSRRRSSFRSRRKLSCAKARPQAARPPRVRCF